MNAKKSWSSEKGNLKICSPPTLARVVGQIENAKLLPPPRRWAEVVGHRPEQRPKIYSVHSSHKELEEEEEEEPCPKVGLTLTSHPFCRQRWMGGGGSCRRREGVSLWKSAVCALQIALPGRRRGGERTQTEEEEEKIEKMSYFPSPPPPPPPPLRAAARI